LSRGDRRGAEGESGRTRISHIFKNSQNNDAVRVAPY
jgi:hypothetical protein